MFFSSITGQFCPRSRQTKSQNQVEKWSWSHNWQVLWEEKSTFINAMSLIRLPTFHWLSLHLEVNIQNKLDSWVIFQKHKWGEGTEMKVDLEEDVRRCGRVIGTQLSKNWWKWFILHVKSYRTSSSPSIFLMKKLRHDICSCSL